MRYKWKIEVTLDVDPTWVADGFDASHPDRIEEIQDVISGLLPYSYGNEFIVKAKILKAPDPAQIRKEQGWEKI